MTDEYQRGQFVKIVVCPTNNQHAGMYGTIKETSGPSRMLVVLESGAWCWPFEVMPADQSQRCE